MFRFHEHVCLISAQVLLEFLSDFEVKRNLTSSGVAAALRVRTLSTQTQHQYKEL